MPKLIAGPTVVQAAGTPPKRIEEYAGHVNTGHGSVSVARMVSPAGWREPGQRPSFEEITVVLKGSVHVEYEGGSMDVQAGQAVITSPGEWVRYSTPNGGAEYIAVCVPAFSMDTVHRDPDGEPALPGRVLSDGPSIGPESKPEGRTIPPFMNRPG
jgi:mannose-6-phosphate isomerase-like protein (cupin superfamily)